MKKRSFVLWYVVWSLSASIVFEQGGSQEDSAEQPTFMRVPQGDGEPQSLFAYVVSSATTSVCPVLAGDGGALSGNDAVIQVNAALPGEFYVSRNLDQAVFNVTNINISRQCFGSSLCCDRLLISRIGDIMRRGNFMVRYVPAEGGANITVTVFYGPAGLSYMGEAPANPDSPLVVSFAGLTFELRVLGTPSGGAPETTVCESVGNGPFQPSAVLETRTATPLRGCLSAFGSFSQPYVVDVRFNESVSDTSALTERKLMVVLGGDCNADGIRSGIFNVIGEALIPEPTDSTLAPPAFTTTSGTDTATIISMTNQPSEQSINNAGLIAGIVAAVVFVLSIIVIPLVVNLVFCKKFCCRTRAGRGAGDTFQLRGSALALSVPGSSSVSIGMEPKSESVPGSRSGSIGLEPVTKESSAIDLSDQTVGVVSFAQDAAWNSDFAEGFALCCSAQCDSQLDTSSSSALVLQKLHMKAFLQLCIIADEKVADLDPELAAVEDSPCVQLLQAIKSSPHCVQFKCKLTVVVIGGSEGVKEGEWSTWVYCQHGTGEETAKKVVGAIPSLRNPLPVVNGSTAHHFESTPPPTSDNQARSGPTATTEILTPPTTPPVTVITSTAQAAETTDYTTPLPIYVNGSSIEQRTLPSSLSRASAQVTSSRQHTAPLVSPHTPATHTDEAQDKQSRTALPRSFTRAETSASDSTRPRSFPMNRKKRQNKSKKGKSSRDLAEKETVLVIARDVEDIKGLLTEQNQARRESDNEIRAVLLDTNEAAHGARAGVEFVAQKQMEAITHDETEPRKSTE